MGASIGLMQILVVVFYVAIWVVPFWKIFPRAGWPAPLSLVMVIPIVNMVMLWVLAFKHWPSDSYGSGGYS